MKSEIRLRIFQHCQCICERSTKSFHAPFVLTVLVAMGMLFCATEGRAVLPSPWESQDVGGPAIAGSATESGGTFTLTAGGWDIWSTADEFHYVYQPVVGDCEIITRVHSVFESDVWAKAGVMIRESLDANSKNVLTAVRAGNGLTFQRRASTGGSTVSTKVGVEPSVDDYDAPYWLRLVRSGDDFSAYYSPDGGATGWTQLGTTQTIAMSSVVYIGLELSSKNVAVGTTAVFTDVSVTGTPLSSTQITVNSFSELLSYLGADNVNVVMTPGTYRITPDDVDSGLFSNPTLLSFTGSSSTFDFTGVTIEVDTRVFRKFGSVEVIELAVWGEDLVLKSLTLIDIGTTKPQKTALGILLDGARNRIEGFDQTIRGSYPYGYGDMFGKGGGYVLQHFKHAAILIRGDDNYVKDCKIYHRAYGHGIFCQGSINAKIEGCYIEGEMRTTDEVLAEEDTGSAADGVGFNTVWGFRIRPGGTFSLQEDGIRAYNTGRGPDGNSRSTVNTQVIDCTVTGMRNAVTIGFSDGIRHIEGCVSIGNEYGYWVSGGDIVESSGDIQFGPLLETFYQNDSGGDVDLTVLNNEEVDRNTVAAYVAGSNHDITFRNPNAGVDQGLRILLGGPKEVFRQPVDNAGLDAINVVLGNLTNYPIEIDSGSSGNSGVSWGAVTNNGSNNNFTSTTVNSCGGFAILQTIQAEDYCDQSGVSIESSSDGGFNVGSIHDGDWIRFDDMFLGSGPVRFEARVAGGVDGGDIEIRLGGVNGELLGTCNVAASATPGTWVTTVTSVTQRRGLHDLYLVFKGDSGLLMNLDSFKFLARLDNPVDRVESDLVGHWKFDDVNGATAADSSGLGNDGTITDAAWVPGVSGTALKFDGNSSQVEIPASVFADIENEISISMWIYGDSNQPLGGSVFHATNSSGDRVLNIHLPADNSNVYWDAGNVGGYDRINRLASDDQFKDQWNHWTFVKNVSEETMKVYHNGVLFMVGLNKEKPILDIVEATIGREAGTLSYDGEIDDVRVYKVALTENEVASLFKSYSFNAPPRAIPASVRVRLGTSVEITLTGTDEEDATLSYSVQDSPVSGVLSGSAPSLVYTPNQRFTGFDSFTFKVNDGESDSALATVSITVWKGQLVAHWALDETSGTVVSDSSGNNHHATLDSGTWGTGYWGGALDFNGSVDSVTLPASAFAQLIDQITLSMWVYGAATQPRADTIFYATNASNDRMLNIHLPWDESTVYWDAGNDAGYDRINKIANSEEFKGKWNHWVFSKDGSTGNMSIYVNGELWHSDTGMIRPFSGITAATLGSHLTSRYYEGMIDDVKLFNYAMSDTEMAILYSGTHMFVTWLAGFPSLSDASWDGDPDNDGIETGLEFVFNSDPEVSDSATLLVGEPVGDGFVFTFTRRVDSATGMTQLFQYSSTLGDDWTDLNITDPKAAEVSIGTAVDGLQTVTVTISEEQVVGGKLFGRLKVSF